MYFMVESMTYIEAAKNRAKEYLSGKNQIMLAIESSCDETAAAVLRGGREILSMSVHSQIGIHRKYGGVVPEIASRSHVERIGDVVNSALSEAGLTLGNVGAVAVTYGPGLAGALLVGISYAKGLCMAQRLPLVGVNHIAGHIAANYLTHPTLEPPFVCLVASGGHSDIVLVKRYNEFELIGKTRDDAAGEAFDKAARALGLPYPGGPELEVLAHLGNSRAYAFRSEFNARPTLEFSFSGIKTELINVMHIAKQRNEEVSRADVAASFQRAVVEILAEKAVLAAKLTGVSALALAGGVSANLSLRETMRSRAKQEDIAFFAPDTRLCTDNAAMIACAGHHALLTGRLDDLSLNVEPGLGL